MNITALIVTYNRLEKLKLCWSSTASIAFTHIVIIDNASTDGSGEWLTALDDPRLTVITSPHNLGGAGGFKQGTQYIIDRLDTEWVVFYDDDSWPLPDFLSNFQSVKDVSWKVYCCKVVDKHNHLCKMNLPFIDMPCTFWDGIVSHFKGISVAPDGNTAMNVSTFSFVGAIISKDILCKSIGYIFSDLFLYYDDIYFSHHLRLQGYRIRYSPELVFIHDIPPAAKGIAPNWKVYYLIRNLILSRFFFQHDRPYTNGAILLRICKYLCSVVNQKRKLEYTGYIFKAIIDGLAHKTGKRHQSVRK